MKTYSTRDLQLAATLSALGHKAVKLDDHETKPNTKLFVFDNKKNGKGTTPEQDAKDYYNKSLVVEPNLLFHYNATLREWVRNELRLE
jgi:hypothetical protein